MAEKAVGGDDGVVYLGKSSFKMKVGVGKQTPPAGTPVTARAVATAALTAPPPVMTRTPPPVLTRSAQPGATPTPPPVMTARTPRPRRPSAPQPPVSFDDDAARIGPRTKFALAGLVLTAFSCGMMFMVAVDRLWPRPRPRAQCEAAPSEIVTAPTSTKGVEAARQAAAVAPAIVEAPPERSAASVAPADPVEAYSKRLAAQPPVEPTSAARPLSAAKALVAPTPRAVHAPVPTPRVPAAAPALLARGRATVVARKRPATAGAAETGAPTESWNDPFAQ